MVAKEDQNALCNDFADPGQRRLDLLARDKRDVVARKRLEVNILCRISLTAV